MKTLLCSLALAALATPALAHPDDEEGGFNPANRFYRPPAAEAPRALFTAAAAQAKARAVVGTMVDRKIVGSSWRAVAPAGAEIREKGGAREWVVTFRNSKERARAKRTLYVFLTEDGEYKAANHTGA